jgi:hypothetical protein
VQDSHLLKTHDDVPKDICEQLYTEEQLSLQSHQKVARTSTAGHPITITNVLLALFYQTSYLVSSPSGTPALDMPLKYTPIDCLNIPGYWDDAVKEYCAWQQSQVKEPELKVEYKTACDVILGENIDLELIRRNPNPKLLTDKGVKRGTAEQVVSDIDYWVENIKRPRTEE